MVNHIKQKTDTRIELDNFLTVTEAAKWIGKSVPLIYKLLVGKPGGVIDNIQVGSLYMVKKDSLIKVAKERGWIRRKSEGGGD